MAAELNKCLDALKAAGLDVPSSAASRKKSSAVQRARARVSADAAAVAPPPRRTMGPPRSSHGSKWATGARKPLAAK